MVLRGGKHVGPEVKELAGHGQLPVVGALHGDQLDLEGLAQGVVHGGLEPGVPDVLDEVFLELLVLGPFGLEDLVGVGYVLLLHDHLEDAVGLEGVLKGVQGVLGPGVLGRAVLDVVQHLDLGVEVVGDELVGVVEGAAVHVGVVRVDLVEVDAFPVLGVLAVLPVNLHEHPSAKGIYVGGLLGEDLVEVAESARGVPAFSVWKSLLDLSQSCHSAEFTHPVRVARHLPLFLGRSH